MFKEWLASFRKRTAPPSKNDIEWRHNVLLHEITTLRQIIIDQNECYNKAIQELRDILKINVRRDLYRPDFDRTYSSLGRSNKLLYGISKETLIIEIGPLHNPIAPKREGWNVRTVDHLSREELINKYGADPNVELSKVEDVDYVVKDIPLSESIPSKDLGKFEACISSHNIEHIPDFIGFFKEMSKILSKDGFISMAVPDKRFCFDFFRPHTTTGEIIEAHINKKKVHSFSNIWDQHFNTSTHENQHAWGLGVFGQLRLSFQGNMKEATNALYAVTEQGYFDCHAWQFTPASFSLIILELQAAGFIDFGVMALAQPEGCEFCVRLGRSVVPLDGEELAKKRLELNKALVVELSEQLAFF